MDRFCWVVLAPSLARHESRPTEITLTLTPARICLLAGVLLAAGGATQVGIWQQQFRPNPSVTGVQLLGQSDAGLLLESSRGPTCLSGFYISSKPAPGPHYRAIRVRHPAWDGSGSPQPLQGGGDTAIALEDGALEVFGDGAVAVENELATDMHFRNVYIRAGTAVNATLALLDGAAAGWVRLPAWSFTSAASQGHIMADHRNISSTGLFVSYPTISSAAQGSSAPPSDLVGRHSWGALSLPSWDSEPVVDAVADAGATPEWVNATDDDGAKLQKAIDAAATPGHPWHGRPVFVPHGTFLLRDTLVLRNTTRLIGGGKHVATLSMPPDVRMWPSPAAPMLSTDACAGCQVVLSDVALYGLPASRLADFQAGSMLVRSLKTEVNGSLANNTVFPLKQHPFVSFSGALVGGKAYGLSLDHLEAGGNGGQPGAGFSLLVVNGSAAAGLHLYQTSIEHLAAQQQMLVTGASNVHVHSLKYESTYLGGSGHRAKTGPMLRVDTSHNVTVFGGSGNYGMFNLSLGGPGIVEVHNSSGLHVAGLMRKPQAGEVDAGAAWVVDAGAGDFVGQLHGALALYKTPAGLGVINEEPARGNEVALSPGVA